MEPVASNENLFQNKKKTYFTVTVGNREGFTDGDFVKMNANGDTTIKGSLTTSGDTTLNGKLTTSGDTTLNGKLTTSGDTALTNLTTSGDTTLKNATISGTAVVQDVEVKGTLKANNFKGNIVQTYQICKQVTDTSYNDLNEYIYSTSNKGPTAKYYGNLAELLSFIIVGIFICCISPGLYVSLKAPVDGESTVHWLLSYAYATILLVSFCGSIIIMGIGASNKNTQLMASGLYIFVFWFFSSISIFAVQAFTESLQDDSVWKLLNRFFNPLNRQPFG